MSKLKKAVTVALVCVNVALVASLVLVASAPPARAQVLGARTDYLVATGRVSDTTAVVYVLDIGKQALAVWTVEKTNKKFVVLTGRSIRGDFPKPRNR